MVSIQRFIFKTTNIILSTAYCLPELYCSNLNIQVDSKGSVEIEGLTEVEVPDFTKARWWYNKGRRVRSTSWTNVNETSSRSHWYVLDGSNCICQFSNPIFFCQFGSQPYSISSSLV